MGQMKIYISAETIINELNVMLVFIRPGYENSVFFVFFLSRNVTHHLVMATLAEQASKLLDFDQKLDITLLDSIVGCMYSGAGEQVSLV